MTDKRHTQADTNASGAAALKDAARWQPIETAPRDGTRVMLWRRFSNYIFCGELAIAEWHGDRWCSPDCDRNPIPCGEWREDGGAHFILPDFTHWMPLPTPPEGSR